MTKLTVYVAPKVSQNARPALRRDDIARELIKEQVAHWLSVGERRLPVESTHFSVSTLVGTA